MIYCLLSTIDSLESQRHRQVEYKGWAKIFHINSNKNKAGVTLLISDKIDLKKETKMDIIY